ncbi:MAG: hypothetical protein RL261_1341, partial [Pseudomonadota bacterium]
TPVADPPRGWLGLSWRQSWLVGSSILLLALAAVFLAARQEHPENSMPTAASPVAEPSVAVLPFESLGGSGEVGVLAFGIAEAVLHQLANLKGLVVIARTSSFSLDTGRGDARAIGRSLDVRYLLEGSVQQEGEQLRVTAQLIDTTTGAHVWSIRFDKPRNDVFEVQDEIAAQVVKALQLSVQADSASRIAGQGTTNFDAYLAYLQGRALLATGRIADGEQAIEQFRRSMRLDPAFAAAYVSLADAEVFTAEFDASEDRAARFEDAGRRASGLIEKALALDPAFGPAYVTRGYLLAFSDLDAAESSYRRGLQLRPSDARAYAGLAAVLFEQPAKRDEALRMLDRARRLDPLEPAHDVTKSVFLLYDSGDVSGAETLLSNVLQRLPTYLPAVTRLGELEWCCRADPSAAIEHLERAIALDPRAHWARRPLVRAYLDVGDVRAAEAVIEESTGPKDVLRLPVLVYRGEWEKAGELAYSALDRQLVTPIDERVAVIAIRRHARLTGQYPRAITALDVLSGVTWAADGVPRVPSRPGLRVAVFGLADMLQQSGETLRARALLDEFIAQMGREMRGTGRHETWYYQGMSVALALSGQADRAIDWLQRGVEAKALLHDGACVLEGDPAYDVLRVDPRFQALERQMRDHESRERAELAQARAAGVVPARD